MKEIITNIAIGAPAGLVWHILTDLKRFPRWNPFIRAAVGDVKEGARLTVHAAPPGVPSVTFKATVTRVIPGQEFRWIAHLIIPGLLDGEHIFEIEPLGENGIRFIQREQLRGLLVPILWRILNVSTRKGFEAMNTALKRRAEGKESWCRHIIQTR
jgi:hypothetical protein